MYRNNDKIKKPIVGVVITYSPLAIDTLIKWL